ncbi:hypothetical protein ACVIWV_006001 [Bradyrhizobium diazoefficiens]|jgi:hypothetical protein|nr:hypothetical protein [Bradyrhizobium diazoefficiens]MBR0860901.1 hypothetical protein [Bradyrhizobium diazoefficiens]MBR0885524.1 hypothetical protein [Bradyrhizobium diazoefficiens]MBR0917417.1 hypothetical protein [Bradyrhizobium diazoefficiens]WLA65485.1 hypothetical protein QNN01_00875 [Bradyrhizobium diazoefficiens]
MRKVVRDVIAAVHDAGGSNVRVSEGGRHTRIHFTAPDGKRTVVLLHRGSVVSRWFPTQVRSQIRRKLSK